MAIRPLEQRKRQQILLIIAVATLIIAGLVLYFGFWRGGVPQEAIIEQGLERIEQERITTLVLEKRIKKIELDFTFLTQTILPILKSYGDLPVQKGTTGRSNPFITY